ncbi:MAG: flagellar basal-body MS-ring/collar protein FliF [Gemmatimonas sp.]
MLESILGRSVSPRQIAIVAVGVVATALVFGLSNYATRPVRVPLYVGLPVETVGEITKKLTELGISYELDETGTTINVNDTDRPRAKVELASAGLPNAGRPGMEIFDRQTWGMTDFTQKVNYARALEGELERTIGSITGVKKVTVHLALEDESLFKQNERPSKASVTLTMRGGDIPKPDVVAGVQTLVSNSIGGLGAEHVAVIDETGRALATDDDGSPASQTSRHLTVQREIEVSLEKKAENILSSYVGSNNSKVQVTALLNFDKIERTTKQVDPEKQASLSEQKAEVSPSSPQQGAGYSTTASSFENSSSVENFVGSVGTIKKLTVAVLVADKVTMPVPDTTATAPQQPTVTARTPEELTKIEALMRTALGVDSLRGDEISVVSAAFNVPVIEAPEVVTPPSLLNRIESNPKPVVWIASLVVLLIIAIVAILALKPRKQKAVAELPAGDAPLQLNASSPAYAELPASQQMAAAMQGVQQGGDYLQMEAQPGEEVSAIEAPVQRQIVLPAMSVSAEREQAIATVEQRPEAAIRVTRNWLRS